MTPGRDNRIDFHVNEEAGGSTIRPGRASENADGRTNSAYWLPYENGGKENSISVPSRPTGDDPRFVLTPGLSGCAFYARPGENNSTVLTHASSGKGETAQVPPA